MLHLDFTQRVVIRTAEKDWVDSPAAGVRRKLLEREEAERGRYPQGTWLHNPHMSTHHPFVEQETIIWVKTGHLPI